jgi:hypothetical protein
MDTSSTPATAENDHAGADALSTEQLDDDRPVVPDEAPPAPASGPEPPAPASPVDCGGPPESASPSSAPASPPAGGVQPGVLVPPPHAPLALHVSPLTQGVSVLQLVPDGIGN